MNKIRDNKEIRKQVVCLLIYFMQIIAKQALTSHKINCICVLLKVRKEYIKNVMFSFK